MFSVFLRLLSIVLAVFALFFGVRALLDANRIAQPVEKVLTNPPVVSFSSRPNPLLQAGLLEEKAPALIPEGLRLYPRANNQWEALDFETFEYAVSRIWGSGAIPGVEKKVFERSYLGQTYVSLAWARDGQLLVFYRPKILVKVVGYGKDPLLLDNENLSSPLVCGIYPFEGESEQTASFLRNAQYPYFLAFPSRAASLEGQEATLARQETLFPYFGQTVSPDFQPRWFSAQMEFPEPSEEELSRNHPTYWRMRAALFESVLASFSEGYSVFELQATIPSIQVFFQVLEEMQPFPVGFVDYLFWELSP